MSGTSQTLRARIEELADTIRRVRRVLPEQYDYLAEALEGHATTLYWWHTPTAAERYRALVNEGLDEEQAVRVAREAVDREQSALERRLR